VLYASKASVYKGHWKPGASSAAAGGRSMASTNTGWARSEAPLANPGNYFEMKFNAAANTSYTVWLRLRAGGNSKWNDSVWVQFSDALFRGRPVHQIGTTRGLLVNLEPCNNCGPVGWGWQNTGYWEAQATTITFATSGTHTIRVQTREDGVEVDQIVLSPSHYLTASPGQRTHDATILSEGSAPSAGTNAPAAINEIALDATDITKVRGHWALTSSPGAAGGTSLRSENEGVLAAGAAYPSPANYFEMKFQATADTDYRVWLRLRAAGNSKWNDSVWVQFSDSLVKDEADYRIGSSDALMVNLERCKSCGTSGWGWLDGAYWLRQPAVVTFPTTGRKTLRVQTREDGVEIDQIILSAGQYMSTAPGRIINDATIVPM
jgi:hypothetical protein